MIVLVAAQTAGAANVLIPVVKELAGRRLARTSVLACGQAVAVFAAAGVSHTIIGPNGDGSLVPYDEARRILTRISPDVLLLGTAWGPSLDKVLLSTANARGIPSVSVVDMWSYYLERFLDAESGGLCLPTKVAVMDRLAFDEAVRAGLPESALVVTGQPYLEALAKRLGSPELIAEARLLRASWLEDSADQEATRLVLFASEAIARDFGPGTSYYRGYTEVETLEGLLEAVSSVQLGTRLDIKTVVKLHPEESPESYRRGPLASSPKISVVAGQHPWPSMLAADVVVGMTSMLLLESAIAGRPTVSFQPGAGRIEPFIGTRLGMVQAASSTAELSSLLTRLLEINGTSAHERAPLAKDGPEFLRAGAASRIADLLVELAGAGDSQGQITAL